MNTPERFPPSVIRVLLGVYYMADLMLDCDADQSAATQLEGLRVVELDDKSRLRTTRKGDVWVESILRVRPPTRSQYWVDAQGKAHADGSPLP